MNLIPIESEIPKVGLGFGRIRFVRLFLKTAMERVEQKSTPTEFHDRIESGKKLFMYLVVLHEISRYLVTLLYLKDPDWRGGRLFFKYRGVMSFRILNNCTRRLHHRLSERVSQPGWSYILIQFEPRQHPVISKAAWYWTYSTLSMSGCKEIEESNILCDWGIW